MKIVKVGALEGAIGATHAHMVMQAIRQFDSTIVPEMVQLRLLQDPEKYPTRLGAILGTLEEALSSGQADICVHHLRDMPARENEDFPIVAAGRRADACDVILCEYGMMRYNAEKPLVCWGAHRHVQLKDRHPAWDIRADDVDSEVLLYRLDTGAYGGVMIGGCELEWIRMNRTVARRYTADQMAPAVGQGIPAVLGRQGEQTGYLARFHNANSWDEALCERTFARALYSARGESAILGAHAVAGQDDITITGMLTDEDGKIYRGTLNGQRRHALQVGAALAAQLLLDCDIAKGKKIPMRRAGGKT